MKKNVILSYVAVALSLIQIISFPFNNFEIIPPIIAEASAFDNYNENVSYIDADRNVKIPNKTESYLDTDIGNYALSYQNKLTIYGYSGSNTNSGCITQTETQPTDKIKSDSHWGDLDLNGQTEFTDVLIFLRFLSGTLPQWQIGPYTDGIDKGIIGYAQENADVSSELSILNAQDLAVIIHLVLGNLTQNQINELHGIS